MSLYIDNTSRNPSEIYGITLFCIYRQPPELGIAFSCTKIANPSQSIPGHVQKYLTKQNSESSRVTFLEKYGLYERKYEELYEKERK